jgi:hypothetical protein
MTETPQEPLSDDDMSTTGGDDPQPPTDADGTDGDASDSTDGDAS